MMARAKALLPSEEKEVVRHVSSGESVRLVAAKFGIAEGTVLRIIKQHGVAPPKRERKPWTQRDQQMLESLYRMKLSPSTIALRMDRPLPTIQGKLRDLRRARENAVLTPGAVYMLKQKPTKTMSGMKDTDVRCVYLGKQRGAGVVHHLFRSVVGGYNVCVSGRQIQDYDIILEG